MSAMERPRSRGRAQRQSPLTGRARDATRRYENRPDTAYTTDLRSTALSSVRLSPTVTETVPVPPSRRWQPLSTDAFKPHGARLEAPQAARPKLVATSSIRFVTLGTSDTHATRVTVEARAQGHGGRALRLGLSGQGEIRVGARGRARRRVRVGQGYL